jgi:hypothetical protein
MVQIPPTAPAAKIGNVEREQPTDGRTAGAAPSEPDQPSAGSSGGTTERPANGDARGAADERAAGERAADERAAVDERTVAVAPDAEATLPPRDPDVPAPAHTGTDQSVPGRSERSPKDMAISLLVLLVPIALLFAFYRVVLGGDEPVRIDPAAAIEQARAAGAFTVSEPNSLSGGWRSVSAAFQSADGGRTLRIGYVSPEGRGVQLVQSSVPAEQLLPAELTRNRQALGVTEVAGRDWQRYSARTGERALVLLEQRRTVIIVGDAAEGELRSLASSLR